MVARQVVVCVLTVGGALALSSPALAGTLSASPDPLVFSPQPYYFGGSTGNLQIANSNDTDTTVTGRTFTGPDAAAFYVAYGDNCATTQFYGPGNTCSIGIGFNPPGPGTFTAQLEITNDGTTSPLVVALTATALAGPRATIAPPVVAFGDVTVGQEVATVVTVSNTGDAPLQVQQALVVTGRPDAFFVTDDKCTFQVIGPGGSCMIVAHFKPGFAGPQDASLFLITGNAPQPVSSIGLNGTGVAVPVAPTPASASGGAAIAPGATSLALTTSPRVLSARGGRSVKLTLTVRNRGGAAARNVRVCERLPGALTARSLGGARLIAGVPCWHLRSLAAGRSRRLVLTLRPACVARTLRLRATARADNARARSATTTVRVACARRAPRFTG